jgi:hypothetical protein
MTDNEYSRTKKTVSGLDNHLERSLEQTRKISHTNDVERYLSDRNFNQNKQIKKGEITGEMFDLSEMETGMPLRSTSIRSKKTDDTNMNKYLDFNVYENEVSNLDIEYNDPMVDYVIGTISKFSDVNTIGTTVLPISPTNNKSDNLISENINKYNFQILNHIKYYNNNSFCISPFCLQSFFGALYLCSKNKTSDILKSKFLFTSKEIIQKEMFNLYYLINYNMANILLLNSQIKINTISASHINKVVILDKIIDNNNKCQTINKWTNDTMNISPVILPNDLQNNSLGLNIISFKPELNILFEKKYTKMEQFNSINKRMVPMMTSYKNTNVKYYEDSQNQVIEISAQNNLSIGFILPKKNIVPEIDVKYINFVINNFQEGSLDKICLPKFKHYNKYKFKTLLKLENILDICDLSDLTYNPIKIDDIIHNCSFILTETNSKYVSSKINNILKPTEFIANHSFIYYVKIIPNNAIVLSGIFM